MANPDFLLSLDISLRVSNIDGTALCILRLASSPSNPAQLSQPRGTRPLLLRREPLAKADPLASGHRQQVPPPAPSTSALAATPESAAGCERRRRGALPTPVGKVSRTVPFRPRADANPPLAGQPTRPTGIVDIADLLKAPDPNESPAAPASQQQRTTGPSPTPSATVAATTAALAAPQYAAPPPQAMLGPASGPGILGGGGGGGRRGVPGSLSSSADSPAAKKQSKWSPEEDALIIELRGSGMKWEDISKRLPGRSAISCRLHYQNYLERRSEWDEDRKNKLARLYER